MQPRQAPTWNLNSLFDGNREQQIARAIEDAGARIEAAARLAEHDKNRGPLIFELADIVDILERIDTYLALSSAVNERDVKFQSYAERVGSISRSLRERAADMITGAGKQFCDMAARSDNGFPFDKLTVDILQSHARQHRHELPAHLKPFYSDLQPGSAQALRSARAASLRSLGPDGNDDLSAQRRDLFSSDPETRRNAWRTATDMLHAASETHAQIYTGLLSLSNTLAIWTGAQKAPDLRHASNDLEGEIVETLCGSVRATYAAFPHKYFALKSRVLGVEKLSLADRLAPVQSGVSMVFTWNEARELVLDSFAPMGPEFLSVASDFFDKFWIDAAPREGKDRGGFCLPGPSAANPFILLNFDGSVRSVLELSHELGHGIHYHMSRNARRLGVGVPFPIAETAAIFTEQLTFSHLVSECSGDARSALLLGRAHDLMNTLFRHTALYDFEVRAHEARKSGLLSADRLHELYEDVHREAFGDSFDFDGSLGPWFITVPHFFNWPFYSYAYAFGEIVAALLHARRRESPSQFPALYIDLLKRGGSQHATGLLAPFKIDPREATTWSGGLSLFNPLMDEIMQAG